MTPIWFLLAYLIGSFPTGRLVARWHGVDITKQGSGNVGATNVARTLGKRAGILTLAADMAKGALAMFIALSSSLPAHLVPWCGLLAVAGHCFPLPPRWKGGKGVATSVGVIAVLSPLTLAISCSLFLLLFLSKRIVSLASIGSALAVAAMGTAKLVLAWSGTSETQRQSLQDYDVAVGSSLLLIALCVVWKHRPNLARLLTGSEERFRLSS